MPALLATRRLVAAIIPLADAAPAAVTLRQACATDAYAVGRFVQALSISSRRLRFHGAFSASSPALARQLCDVDGRRHLAWLAWTGTGDEATVVGEARLVLSDCGTRAELAMAVADSWQGRGVADALMQQLLDAAAARGVARLSGDVMDGNGRMQSFMHRHGFVGDCSARGEALRMSRDLLAEPAPQRMNGWRGWLSAALFTPAGRPGLALRLVQP
jgi:GNAT superfamily N-acetyltransferase